MESTFPQNLEHAASQQPAAPAGPQEKNGALRDSLPRFAEVEMTTLRAAQKGDSRALCAFVECYQDRVFAFLARSVGRGPWVEDLAQDVFLKACRALPRLEVGRAKVSTWLFQISVRTLQDYRKRARPHLVEVGEDLGDPRLSPEEVCARRRQLSRLEAWVDALPPEQRMALALVEFEGLTLAEVGIAMNCPVATVKTRVHRARATLRRALRAQEEVG